MSIYQCIYYIHAAPSAPLNLTFSPGGVLNDSITFTWLPPEEPNGVLQFYQLKQSSSGGVMYVNTTDNTTIVLSSLVPGTQYNFSVRAFTVAFGPFSDQLTLYTADGEDYMSSHYCHKMYILEENKNSFFCLPHFSTLDASECQCHQHWFYHYVSDLEGACCIFP